MVEQRELGYPEEPLKGLGKIPDNLEILLLLPEPWSRDAQADTERLVRLVACWVDNVVRRWSSGA